MSLTDADLDQQAWTEHAAALIYLKQHPRARATSRRCAFCRLRIEDGYGLLSHGGTFCTSECVQDWLSRVGCCAGAA